METSSFVAGVKRKTSERPRSYAISSEAKRPNNYSDSSDVIEHVQHDNPVDLISKYHDELYHDIWEKISLKNNSEESIDLNVNTIKFRIDSMNHCLKTLDTHLDLILFHKILNL
jgi:hypothetical protein